MTNASERLQRLYPDLSPQLRQGARYILDHPEEVALNSMRRLAEHAGVKPSTLVRLARAVGYEGYNDMRAPYAEWIRSGEGPYVARARSIQERDGASRTARLVEEMTAADMAGLKDCARAAGPAALEAARDALSKAARVYVLGLRSCFSVAYFFHYAYRMLGGNSVLLDGLAATFADNMRGFGPGDALFAVSVRPYTRETVAVVEFAAARGGTVVAVTDSLASPLARHAHVTLMVSSNSPGFFQSLVPALATAQMLVAALAAEGGKEALKALGESERQLSQFEAYWRDSPRKRKTP